MSVNLIVANTFEQARRVADKVSGIEKSTLIGTSYRSKFKVIDLTRNMPEFVWIYIPSKLSTQLVGFNKHVDQVYVAKGSRLPMFAYNYLRTQFVNVKVIDYATA